MTLRTTSVRRQRQAWACLVLLGVIAYFVLVLALGLGNPFRFFGSHQMRVLLPLVVLLRLLAREFRWDGVVREEKAKSRVEVEEGKGEEKVGGESRSRAEEEKSKSRVEVEERNEEEKVGGESRSRAEEEHSPTEYYEKKEDLHSTTTTQSFNSSPVPSADAAAMWEKARVMVHNVIPNPQEDAEYLNLVFSAAEQGYVPALAKLGDYAFRRGTFVEAYFWTTIAKRRLELEGEMDSQGLREINNMLRTIRRGWTAAGQPPEYENVYDSFPEERGELGRAFLRLDGGVEVKPTQDYIRALAEKGNPDAALFVEK